MERAVFRLSMKSHDRGKRSRKKAGMHAAETIMNSLSPGGQVCQPVDRRERQGGWLTDR